MAAARRPMQQLGEHDGTDTVARHLDRFTTGTTLWQEATGSALVGRLVDAPLISLTTPPGAPAASRPRVSAVAARSRSTTTPAGPRPRSRPSPPAGSRPHRPRARGVRGDGAGSPAAVPPRLRPGRWRGPRRKSSGTPPAVSAGRAFSRWTPDDHCGMLRGMTYGIESHPAR
ncbi:hypothetical protein [Streptomyces erythrochromogenes]|uniref:hypothetical protein n=1 Tax=Streptomyces erythrochromogenes TaxID=285574 RepID=UPI00386AA248|nr:hypothetical protein OG364_00970 [Streptomyces erythrochromogenes]WST98356.1 hypothetical protein OG364_40565 [Streptomyces erythrochromogenes]